MNKKVPAAIILLTVLIICGCGKKDNKASVQPTVPVEEKKVPVVAETVKKTYDKAALESEILEITDNITGNWSVYTEVLNEDFNLEINNRVVTAASIIKLFNMATLYNEISWNNIEMNDVIAQSLFEMITISSNNESNYIVTVIGGGDFSKGAEKVTEFAHQSGCEDTKEEHMLYDESGPARGQNTTTVKDCGNILKKIYNKECVSPEYDEEMLELLKKQTKTWKIPKGVPEGIIVANKTGENSKIELDAAIVFSPECDYILCISVTDFGNTNVHSTFGQISETVYNFYNNTETAETTIYPEQQNIL